MRAAVAPPPPPPPVSYDCVDGVCVETESGPVLLTHGGSCLHLDGVAPVVTPTGAGAVLSLSF